MSDVIETIKVVCKEADRGWKIINKHDLQEDDKIYQHKELKKRKPKRSSKKEDK